MKPALFPEIKTWKVVGMILTLALTVGAGQAWAACVNPPANMTAWYPLNEPPGAPIVLDVASSVNPSSTPNHGTPKDSSGGSTTVSPSPGAPPAGPVPTTAPPLNMPGMVQNALYFYGPYVEVADQADIKFGTGDFTIDTWIRDVIGFQTGFVRPIVDKLGITTFNAMTQTGSGSGYAFYVEDGRLKLVLGDGAAFSVYQSDPIPPLNPAWHHVAVTVSRSTPPPMAVAFYLDGAQVTTATTPPVPAASLDNVLPLWIGKSRLSSPTLYGFMETALDELEIFKRVLSTPEIQSLYNAGSAGKCRVTAAGVTSNLASYTSGNSIILSATITPGTENNLVDGYLKVVIPGGSTYYLMSDLLTWGTGLSPIVSNITTTNFSGAFYSTTVPMGLPVGTYNFSLFGVIPGSDPSNPANLRSNIATHAVTLN